MAEVTEITKMPNGYLLVDGVKMHAEQGARFEVPHPSLKAHVGPGHWVELRVDSPRFTAHPGTEPCECEHCREPMNKPILCHEEPNTILSVPPQSVPSRGWGEQFWVQVTARNGAAIQGRIDNRLYETPLHELNFEDPIAFHETHILAVHPAHHRELLSLMNEQEFAAFGEWLSEQSE